MGREDDFELSRSDDEEEIVFTPAEHHESFNTEKAKAIVVLVAGCLANGTLTYLLIIHSHSILKGGPGLGIDLNHVLLAYAAAMGLIIRWAYPPKEKK